MNNNKTLPNTLKYKLFVFIKALTITYNSHKSAFILILFLVLLQTIFPVIAIYSSSHLISDISQGKNEYLHSLIMWGIALLIHHILSPIISFLQSNLGDKSVYHINKKIMEKSESLQSMFHFEDQNFYNDIQIIKSGAQNKPINLVVTSIALFNDLCLIFYSTMLLISQIKSFAVIVLSTLIFHAIMMSKQQHRLWIESLGRSPKSRMMAYISSLTIHPESAKEMKIYPLHKYLMQQYSNIFHETYHRMFRMRMKLTLSPVLPSIILLAGNLLAVYQAIASIESGVLGIGSIAMILQLMNILHGSVLTFGQEIGWITDHLLFFEKLFEFLKAKEPPQYYTQVKKNKVFLDRISSITFENVSFNYPDGREALKNIHFHINPCEKIALIGENGAGKTTLIKLICGFYMPTSGTIQINNIPMENIHIDSIRNLLGTVFQDFCRYALPLDKNITMSGEQIEENKASEIIQMLGCDFISNLPHKYQQLLGKPFGGTELSIGEWQKIAIARALYKNPSLLLLDEPTSSLDAHAEHEIYKNFEQISKNRITIFITHRLASVSLSDKVLFLSKGHQVAFDTHANLYHNNLDYKNMYSKQSAKYIQS